MTLPARVRDEPFWRWAPDAAEHVALTVTPDGPISAAALEADATALARELLRRGGGPVATVVLVGLNLRHTAEALVAASRLDAQVIPVPLSSCTADRLEAVASAGPVVAVAPPDLASMARDVFAEVLITPHAPGRRVIEMDDVAPPVTSVRADAAATAAATLVDLLGITSFIQIGFALPHLDPGGLAYLGALLHGRCSLASPETWTSRTTQVIASRARAVDAARAAIGAGAVLKRVVAVGRVAADDLRDRIATVAGDDVLVEYGLDEDGVATLLAPDGPVAGFWSWARSRPNDPVVASADGRVVTAGQMLDAVEAFVPRLAAAAPNRTIAVVSRDDADVVLLHLAAARAGVDVHVVDPDAPLGDVARLVAAVGADVVIADSDSAATVRAATTVAVHTLASLPARSAHVTHNRVAGMLLTSTSGTTGAARIVRKAQNKMSPEVVAAHERVLATRVGLPGVGAHLVTAGLRHPAALTAAAAALHGGQSLLLMASWSPADAVALLARKDVTSTFMVPSMFASLLALGAERHRPAGLRAVLHGAAPCPLDVKTAMIDWWGPVLFEHYSASEAAATYVTPDEWLRRPGTVGRPFPGVVVRVLRPDGSESEVGEVGDVYVSDAGVVYHDGTAPYGRRDGLISLGDRGFLDDDGWLFLRGRASEYISVGGTKFHPSDVESVIRRCAGVADCAVVGIAHGPLGQVVAAYIVPDPSARDDVAGLRRAVLATARRHLPSYQLPMRVVFVDTLPRDVNGKLRRRDLVDIR